VANINHRTCKKLGPKVRLFHSNDRKTVQNTNVNYITQTSQYILPHTSNAKELLQRLLIQPNGILHHNHNHHQNNNQNHLNQRYNGVTIHENKRTNSIDPVQPDNYFSKNQGDWNMAVS
jgi:hypothetical protein